MSCSSYEWKGTYGGKGMDVIRRIEELRKQYGNARDIAPLPDSSYTQPNIVITAHRHGSGVEPSVSVLSNFKEI